MKQVLIVDDAPDITQILGFILKKMGYDVLVAGEGQAARDLAQQSNPVLALVDYNLPDITGNELAKQLKEIHHSLTVILISGDDNVDYASQGFDGFVQKPFTANDIQILMQQWVKKD